MGEQAGEEDPQEATAARALCTLLATRLHEGPTQPVHEEAQSTAPHQQEQVESQRGGEGGSEHCLLFRQRVTKTDEAFIQCLICSPLFMLNYTTESMFTL